MKLSGQEKAALRAAFRTMTPAKKLEHIWTYYKWPIFLILFAVLVLGSAVQRAVTRKDPLFYLAFTNVAIGSDLEQSLTADYLSAVSADPKKQEVYLYRDLYLSEDADVINHEYAYASRMKLMGAIQAHKLDVAIMNQEAYDLLSQHSYLTDLSGLLQDCDAQLREQAEAFLTENIVVLQDNAIAWQLNEAEEHVIETKAVRNALDITDLPLIQAAGMSDRVFLGIIANSSRVDEALAFIRFLIPTV